MMKHWWEKEHPERMGINGKIYITSVGGDTLQKFSPDFGAELRFCFSIGSR